MKVKELFEGKEERYGVQTTTEQGTRITYFASPSERDAYISKLKEKLGSKLKNYKAVDKFTVNSVLKK